MAEVTIRELRNHGGDVVERAARGETLTVTRAGVAVARLSPLPRRPLDAGTVLARRRGLPAVDPQALRTDLDEVMDPSL